MPLAFKKDFEKAVERIEAWWEREIIDRVCIQVEVPPQEEELTPPADLRERWTDVDYVITSAERKMSSTFWGGEALPVFYPNLGPDVFAAYLDCDLQFGETTSWSVPLITDWENPPPLRLDHDNRWWRLTQELTAQGIEAGQGKFIIGLTDLHGGGDALAALRDPQVLCQDLIDHPDRVKEAMVSLENIWFDVYEGLYGMIEPRMGGSTTWLRVWSSGRYYPVSCDFICMISKEMFEEFFLGEIIAEINWLDRSLFHLDGPGAVHHLDTLLAIPNLDGIQWVPGAGRDEMLQWLPLLKRIQEAGKCLHLSLKAEEIKALMAELSPKGLMLATTAGSIVEAESLLKEAERWTLEGLKRNG